MAIHQGDIYWVQLSHSEDHLISGNRPVVVLSNNIINRVSKNVTVVPLSTNSRLKDLTYSIEINLYEDVLKVKSYAMILQSRLIESVYLGEKAGSVNESCLRKLCDTWVSVARPTEDLLKNITMDERLEKNRIYQAEEDLHYEFKEIRPVDDPHKSINDKLSEYICAFLNSNGGVILFGINDERIVKGVSLSSEQKNAIRTLYYTKIREVKPKVIPDDFNIRFIEVEERGKIIDNLYVIEFSVPAPFDSTIVYLTSDNKLFIKLDGVCQKLDVVEMQNLVKKRIVHKLDSERRQ